MAVGVAVGMAVDIFFAIRLHKSTVGSLLVDTLHIQQTCKSNVSITRRD